MAQKILGIDLGTNSIGLSLRNVALGENLTEQLEFFTSCIFQCGSNGQTSYASERTAQRQSRRQKERHRRRLWATLQLLIQYGYCPMSIESLKQWRTYYKEQPHHRYPLEDKAFDQWIKLDFNGDGKPDYSSPYQIRRELAEVQLDFTKTSEKYKLGRALYQIAQRRGFKSSKGEKAEDDDAEIKDELIEKSDNALDAMKKSEEKASSKLVGYMKEHKLRTAGEAFALLEDDDVRVRASDYKTVRSLLMDEIRYIFTFQDQLSTDSDFYKSLMSKGKSGTIFYQLPQRSNKDLVGKCTLEPLRQRCHTSHPAYEEFAALQLINNIRYRENTDEQFRDLPLQLKKDLYNEVFLSTVKTDAQFQKIREYLQKRLGFHLEYNSDKKKQTINYDDNFSVSLCPVTARLIRLFGENWSGVRLISNKKRKGHNGQMHAVTYDIEDILEICFLHVQDPNELSDFALQRLGWTDKDKIKKLVLLADSMTSQYGLLSLKALKSINRMLRLGLKYSDAVMLAKIPDIINIDDDGFKGIKNELFNSILPSNNRNSLVVRIANKMIANYKALNFQERFADHNQNYRLQPDDYQEIEKQVDNTLGSEINEFDRKSIVNDVAKLYQDFFSSVSRDYVHEPKVRDVLIDYLKEHFQSVPSYKWDRLYHHSAITKFRHTENHLGTPNLGSIKNPVALRTLNILRRKINQMIDEGLIAPDDTRIVVETARDMNDANVRAALTKYNQQRENENKAIFKLLTELYPNDNEEFLKGKVPTMRYALEQSGRERYDFDNHAYKITTDDIKKYRLWKEQDCRSIYTGKPISLSTLLDGQSYNIEHTIPRSRSFDDSESNQTICEAYYNQHIKGTKLPTELPNYDKDWTDKDGRTYTAIKPRLKKWEDELEKLDKQVEFWRKQARRAITKERKDFCIQQLHLWDFEADYWRRKLSTFTTTEITDGFRHRQLVDTRVITRYAVMYLKSLFRNVDVEKGETTAVFRKILGVQSVDVAKNRTNNAHHAIDATMLTLVPIAAKRNRMMKLFYAIQEKTSLGHDCQHERYQLKKDIEDLEIGKRPEAVKDYIEKNILVEHIKSRDALSPSIHFVKVKKDGKKHKELRTEKHVIRGELHEQTYLGAITQWERKDGKIVRDENNRPVVSKEKIYVTRIPLKYKESAMDKGFTSWEDLEKKIVNKDLVPMMKKQFPDKTSFKDATKEGIYMLNKKGEKVNIIKTVRCDSGIHNPEAIREQTYKSEKEYKNYYYAKGGDLYALCEYCHGTKLMYQTFNLMDISNRRKSGFKDIPDDITDNKGQKWILKRLFRPGDTVLVYDKSPYELRDLDTASLASHLYVVNKIEKDLRITLVRSSFAGRTTNGIIKNPTPDVVKTETVKDFKALPTAIRMNIRKLNLLQEGIDFTTEKGQINFKPSAYD